MIDVDPKTGKRKQATDSIMARSPTPKDTKNVQESMELGDEIKALNAIYELQKAQQDVANENVSTYVVRPGDSITDILERTGMSFSEFSALNDDITGLNTGDRVQVIKREVI